MAVTPQILVPTATNPQRGWESPNAFPKNFTVMMPAAIAVITKGSARSVLRPALVKLNLIPNNMMPIRSMVEAQNFRPGLTVSIIESVLPRMAPIMIAIIIELIGLFVKPSSVSPTNRADS